jgi:hypothetical protein
MANVQPADANTDFSFPVAGTDLRFAYGDQRPLQMPNGEWGRTTRSGVNVRGYEALSQRKRGGARPGLSRYVSTPVVANWLVQGLNTVTIETGTPVQLSQSGRLVFLVAVSQGNVYSAQAGATSWTAATNTTGRTPPLVYTGQVMSAVVNQQVFFADGSNWVFYQPSDNTVHTWTASAGTLPVDSNNNTPRLICTWRGRIVVSGLLNDPQDIFASAVTAPANWDYSGATTVPGANSISAVSPATAWNLSASPVGLVGDVVTALIPWSDDVLIIGGDSSIYALNGDPQAGGQLDRVSDSIGIAWGKAWCKGPDGTTYFFSNRTGIYAMEPGGKPVRISQQIEQLVNTVDTGANTIQLAWNDRFQGFHCFITPTASAQATTHLFWEQRTGAWWQDSFANNNHNPTAVCPFDGNTATDRTVLVGGWDGYVRAIDPTAATDDGTAISSSVLIGPLVTKDLDEILLKDLQAVLGETSGSVSFAVYVGASAEKALNTTPVATGTWAAGRNLTNLVRFSGHAVYVKITSTNAWAMEQVRARVATQGKVRRRGA